MKDTYNLKKELDYIPRGEFFESLVKPQILGGLLDFPYFRELSDSFIEQIPLIGSLDGVVDLYLRALERGY